MAKICVDFVDTNRNRIPDFWNKIIFLIIGALIMLVCVNVARGEEITLTASWYSVSSLKKDGQWKITKGRMANGKLFDENAFTAASCDYPLGTKLQITNVKNPSKKIKVTVTDRINKRFKGKRIDLTPAAMEALGGKQALKKGLLPIRVEKIK